MSLTLSIYIGISRVFLWIVFVDVLLFLCLIYKYKCKNYENNNNTKRIAFKWQSELNLGFSVSLFLHGKKYKEEIVISF